MTVLWGTVPDLCTDCDGHGFVGDFVTGSTCKTCNGTGHEAESLQELLDAGECGLYPDD